MSCDCNSTNAYGNVCRQDIPYPNISHESVPSMMDNLISSLYGVIEKTVVNGRIVWIIPCDPVTSPGEIAWLPREDGEGLLCYILRAFNDVFPAAVTLTGVQTLTNKTLTAPVINAPTGILASDITSGAFGAGVTLAGTQLTGTVPNARTTGTNLNSPVTLVLRDSVGDFAAGVISADLLGDVTGTLTGNVTGNVTGNLTGNVTGNLTGNAATATYATTSGSSTTASSVTNLLGGATGSLPFQSGDGTTSFLAAGTQGYILTQSSGAPAWGVDHKGSATNNDAAAGYVGEYISATVANGSAVTLTTATTVNITSISLTAGDWDVFGTVNFSLTGVTSTFGTSGFIGGVSTTSATLGIDDAFYNIPLDLTNKTGSLSNSIPRTRISIASTTTVYLVARATFSGGGAVVKGFGTINARRAR